MTADRLPSLFSRRETIRRAHRRLAFAVLGIAAAGSLAVIVGALARWPGSFLFGVALVLGSCLLLALGAAGAFRPLGISGARRQAKQSVPTAVPAWA